MNLNDVFEDISYDFNNDIFEYLYNLTYIDDNFCLERLNKFKKSNEFINLSMSLCISHYNILIELIEILKENINLKKLYSVNDFTLKNNKLTLKQI